MQILGLLGMYFDAAVVFVKNFSLLFRLTLAISTVVPGEQIHYAYHKGPDFRQSSDTGLENRIICEIKSAYLSKPSWDKIIFIHVSI